MAVEPVHATPVGATGTFGSWRGALGSPTGWLRDIAISAALSVWMGLLGPFGAYRAGPPSTRVACYLSMSLIAVTLYGVAGRLAVKWGRRRGVSPWISVALAVLIASAPASGVAALLVPAFFPGAAGRSWPGGWYLQAVVLNLPIAMAYVAAGTILMRLSGGRALNGARLGRHAVESHTPRLLTRLSTRAAGKLLAISGEDHYVRVHTEGGSELLLMRFSDAIAEVDGVAGVRPHRSWWVARCAIAGSVSNGRQMRLRLANGLDVPVARSAARAIRQVLGES